MTTTGTPAPLSHFGTRRTTGFPSHSRFESITFCSILGDVKNKNRAWRARFGASVIFVINLDASILNQLVEVRKS